MIDAVIGTSQKSAAGAIPAEAVAKVVERCLTAEKPPKRKLVGNDAVMAAIARRFLPEGWFEGMLRKAIKV